MIKVTIVFLLFFLSYFVYPVHIDIQEINNEYPLFGEFIFNTELAVSLKESNNDDTFMFDKINDITIDSKGNIYLLDSNRVLKYSPKGKYLNMIGRIGQGPGEFSSPQKIFIDVSDQIYVNDQGRIIIVYNKDGQFIRNIKLDFAIPAYPLNARNFFIDEKENIYALTREYTESRIKIVLIKSNRNGKVLKSIGSFNDYETKFQTKDGGGVVGGIFHPYSHNYYFQVIQDSYLCFSHNMEYKFTIYDLEAKIISIFTLNDKPQSITNKEKRILGKKIIFPPHRPFYSGLLSDEQGRIYVLKSKSITDETNSVKIDIFSKSGRYLYKSELPYSPNLIKKGSIIIIDKDENGMRCIKIFAVKNYDKLRDFN